MAGVKYEMVADVAGVMELMARGDTKRVVAAMRMNARSSRGHAVFTIYLKEMRAIGGERDGKLTLVRCEGRSGGKGGEVRGEGGALRKGRRCER